MKAYRFVGGGVAALLLVLAACSSSQRVLMPPRVDLHGWGTIGMLDFASPTDATLAFQTSREFLTALQAAQPGVPVLELGPQRQALAPLGHTAINPEAIRALGERHHVNALLVGSLDAKSVQPRFSVRHAGDHLSAGAAAELEAALTVRLYDTRTGATIWTSTASGHEPLGGVFVGGGDFASVRANNPTDAEVRLVRCLVRGTTGDLWPYWVRR
jgi:hypothetical protein